MGDSRYGRKVIILGVLMGKELNPQVRWTVMTVLSTVK